MRGEFIGVWPETWNCIWDPLAAEESAPDDLFCELFRELSGYLTDLLNADIVYHGV